MSVEIIIGDCREVLRSLPSASVHCCVTSPPYFGLRSYLRAEHPSKHLEIGLEETPDEFVGKLVGVFREVRRVLRGDGTLWLNIGDSYAGSVRGIGDTKTPGQGDAGSGNRSDLDALRRGGEVKKQPSGFDKLRSQATPKNPNPQIPDTKSFLPGSHVRHQKYGTGLVLRREGSGDNVKLTVSFPGYGQKKLIEKYANLEKA